MRPLLTSLFTLTIVAVAGDARAAGEEITDVRIVGNMRTSADTIDSIAGLDIGDTFETDTLDKVRERLSTTGLFADVNVWWEQYRGGVRVYISVKDKFPWAPVPTASWSANNKSLGLVFVHGNLFGRGKQLLLGGRLATVDSGLAVAYRDPALLGSWGFWQLQGMFNRQDIPEYRPFDTAASMGPFRSTLLHMYGVEPGIGIAWFRRVKTQVAWRLEKITVEKSYVPMEGDDLQTAIPDVSSRAAVVGTGKATLTFDFRAREFAVMYGTALSGGFELSSPSLGSDIRSWRVGASWEHGIRFFRSHNLIYFAHATMGHNLPFWSENTAGGPNLRGYLYQQFRGNTQLSAKVEYHFPLFSVGSMDFRALGFYDASALWFRNLPSSPDPSVTGYAIRDTPDQRSFYLGADGVQSGFKFDRDVHTAVGGGLRFFLRSVAVPLLGFDAGYGLESKMWRFLLIVGA